MSLSRVINIEDLRRVARSRVPKVVFDYIDGGAEDEVTLRSNRRSFQQVIFRPRQAISIRDPDLRTRILGTEIAFPALLAPVGYSTLMHTGGEIAAARAAGQAGIGYILSTISGQKLEHVKAATSGPAWYQLYLLGGRDAAERAIERAHNAGYTALVITVDTAVAGARERDPRNGMRELIAGSVLAKLPYLPQILIRPRWFVSFLLAGGVPNLANVIVAGKGPMTLMDVSAALMQSAVTWADLNWIRIHWRRPIIVKGILTAEDAKRAIDAGADAIVVSNHGGRQLDGVSASIEALPEIVTAVGTQTEVLMDGGIRRGSDIVKAICLGARAVLIGRAYAYGLAAGGEAGIARALELLRDDVERTLRLIGCPSVRELNSSYVDYPGEWRRNDSEIWCRGLWWWSRT